MTRARVEQLPKDDWRGQFNPAFAEPQLTKNLQTVEALRAIGNAHGCSPGAVAIAWVLHDPAITGAIVGLRRPSQLASILPAVELHLNAAEIRAIEHG